MEKDSLMLIDGNALINRAYYAMIGMTTSRGEPIGALYGFSVMLIKLIEEYKPKYMAAVFDVHAPTFRHKMYDGYKATRKPMQPELARQIDELKPLLAAMGIKTLELAGYEADDIIGTLAERNVFTYIVTSDRDSLQLVSDNTHVLLTKHGITEIVEIDPQSAVGVFGVPADRVVDYKALAGDVSDNIPGVAGIGDKTAVELLTAFGSLDGIYEHISEIAGARRTRLADGEQSARLSYKLAEIDRHVPIDCPIEQCALRFPFPAAARTVFERFEFKSIFRRDELFEKAPEAPVSRPAACVQKTLASLDELRALADGAAGSEAAILVAEDGVHFALDGNTDYFAPVTNDLFSVFTRESCMQAAKSLFSRRILAFDLKSLLYLAAPTRIPDADDIALMNYLLEFRMQPVTAAELFGLRDECAAELTARGMTELYEKIELPLLRVLYDMEVCGLSVDMDALDRIDDQFSALVAANEARIREMYGDKPLNLNSPKQLATALFVELGIPYPGKPPYSTKAEILQQLAGEHEIVDEILKYRFNSKIKSTFIDGVRKTVRADRTVHTSFNQMNTSTGRLSSTEPNLQNIPTRTDEGRILRSMFAAKPGNYLVDADYRQIELKLLAHYSGDTKLIDAFNNGEDIHRSTAAEIFSVAPADVTAAMRRDAKAVNFGIIYGISNYGLGRNIHISPKKAETYIKKYFERFPAVKEYLDGLVASAKANGYAITAFGRRRSIPELSSAQFNTRKFGERVAMNMPLQGTAADIIKIAMINVHARLAGMKSRLVLQVHDELVIDTAPDELDAVKAILKSEMENAVKLSVPLDIDIAVGRNWMECK